MNLKILYKLLAVKPFDMNTLKDLNSYLQALQVLNGHGELRAADGQFLGRLSSNPHLSNSIINPNTYGHSHYYASIKNFLGLYGGQSGLYSPYNCNCIKPPRIWLQGLPVLVLTQNSKAVTHGLPILDPDVMLAFYEKLNKTLSHLTFNSLEETTQNYVNQVLECGRSIALIG